MDKQTSNIVVIVLAVIGGLAIIGLLGMWLMPAMMSGMMGGSGMMSCCGGMLGFWILGVLLTAVFVVIGVLLLRK